MVLTTKHLERLMQCSQKTAQRRAKKIRDHYAIEHITVFHLAEYLGLTPMHLAAYWAHEASKPHAEKIDFPKLRTKKDKLGQQK